MPKPRGKEHTSLTETAALVVRELERLPGIKMIAPGEIRSNARKRSGGRFVTITLTRPGFEMLISGQSVQKVAVHTDGQHDTLSIIHTLKTSKRLRHITFNIRERKPGV